MSFPASLPSYIGYIASETLAAANNAAQLNLMQSDITALGTKVGIGTSVPTLGTFLAGNASGSTWRALTSSDIGFSPQSILQQVYPVGCIYTEITGVNPSVTFGFGTWIATGTGRVLVGAGTSDETFIAGQEGGESNHSLIINEMPSHSHTVTDPGHVHLQTIDNSYDPNSGGSAGHYAQNSTGSSASPSGLSTQSATTGVTNNNTGDGVGHNNLQPYQVVFHWQRTA